MDSGMSRWRDSGWSPADSEKTPEKVAEAAQEKLVEAVDFAEEQGLEQEKALTWACNFLTTGCTIAKFRNQGQRNCKQPGTKTFAYAGGCTKQTSPKDAGVMMLHDLLHALSGWKIDWQHWNNTLLLWVRTSRHLAQIRLLAKSPGS